MRPPDSLCVRPPERLFIVLSGLLSHFPNCAAPNSESPFVLALCAEGFGSHEQYIVKLGTLLSRISISPLVPSNQPGPVNGQSGPVI